MFNFINHKCLKNYYFLLFGIYFINHNFYCQDLNCEDTSSCMKANISFLKSYNIYQILLFFRVQSAPYIKPTDFYCKFLRHFIRLLHSNRGKVIFMRMHAARGIPLFFCTDVCIRCRNSRWRIYVCIEDSFKVCREFCMYPIVLSRGAVTISEHNR